MNTPVQPIKPSEQSAGVATLQAALTSLGFKIDPAEANEQRAGDSTTAAVRQIQTSLGIAPQPGTLVDEATAAGINRIMAARDALATGGEASYLAYGTVTLSDDRPARAMPLKLFDQDLRNRQVLGQAVTNAAGKYRISYNLSQFQQAEMGGPDLVLEAYGASGEVLKTSGVYFNAPAFAQLDLVLDQLGSEAHYDRIVRFVTPLLAGQGVTLDTLDQNDQVNDLGFLAGETGIALEELTSFATSRRMPRSTDLPSEFWFAVLSTHTIVPDTTLDNSLGIAGLAASVLAKVPNTPSASLDTGLQVAFTRNLIDSKFKENASAWLKQYATIARREALKEGSSETVRVILAASGIPAAKQESFLDAYLGGGSREDILTRIKDGKQFSDQEIQNISATLVINDLTLGDAKLLAELRKGVPDPTPAATIARMSQKDWLDAIARSGSAPPEYIAGDTAQVQQNNYATLLAKRAAISHPTAAFAGELARNIEGKGKPAVPNAAQVLSFLTAHPDFELGTTAIEAYIENKAKPEFFNAANKDQFVSSLKATQRVFKLAPNYATANTLLTDNLHSAQLIYRMGESQFVQKYSAQPGFSEDSARKIFQRAANTHAAVITIVGDLRATQNANAVRGLSNPVSALDNFPNLKNLFGNFDTCDCQECQSIFGPSAYLADLLHYLDGRLLIPPTGTVKDILFSRRADIGYIEMTCENSNTPLPYIDLVCETLEDRIAQWKLFTLPLALVPDFVEGLADANIVNAFAAANPAVSLSSAAHISAKDKFNSWVIHDTAETYRVQQTAANLMVSILRQTHGTADELASNPEYVNADAYTAVSAAVSPLSLPFDLFSEEIRGYLKRLNVNRSNVMTTFHGPNAPNNPQDIDIASEYLGITQKEQSLILQADPDHQFLYWGKPWGDNDNPTTITAMTEVDTFLNRTGLEYADLQRMLTLSFVNPGGAIAIQFQDSSCDTSKQTLKGLDKFALDRIHRFLRLWKKLGWKMWEVDLVIEHPALGNQTLDAPFALCLYPFLQIKNKLGTLTVEQLGAFFSPINTAPKFTAAYQKLEPSLYENLFLNKRLTNPIDPAFAVDAVTAAAPIANLDDPAHIAPVLAATKLKQTDLLILANLMQPANGPAYIDNKLRLKNLSFLYRHAILAKSLRVKVQDWQTLLFLLQQDVFKDPATTWGFLKLFDRIQASGFSIDRINYILTADPTAKAALADKAVTPVLSALQKSLFSIAGANDPSTMPTTADALSGIITTQLQTLGWDSGSITQLLASVGNQIQQQRVLKNPPLNFDFPAAISSVIRIGFDKNTNSVRFTGVMTDAEKNTLLTDPSLLTVTPNPSYQRLIGDLYDMPRLLFKLYSPSFQAPLAALPNAVQFGNLSSKDLAAKIQYDAIGQQLDFFGIMSVDEQDALNALSNDAKYQGAIQSLFNQPRIGAFDPSRLWLTLAALAFPLENNLASNLKTAEAGLGPFVSRKSSTDQVVQQLAAAFALTQAVTNNLLTTFAVLPLVGPKHTILQDFLDPSFVNSSSAITPDAFPELFEGYNWTYRVGMILKTLAATYSDLVWISKNPAVTGFLDLKQIPVSFNPANPPSTLPPLIALADFLQMNHAWSDDATSFLEVMDKLIGDPTYTNDLFAADVEALNGWTASDVKALTAPNAIDLVFPGDYLKVDTWLRLKQAFLSLGRLNASANLAIALAKAAPGPADSANLKQTIQSKFDEDTWLSLSKEIQDDLRQRKRDALVAYLLAQPMPADAPTQKWEDPEDLFAYYLIDVEMCSCQPSSRIVQASAAVQLLVQRCLMGLEPQVRVSVDADSAWAEWAWMKYYRVWEANRRVFAYPENYAEPELRKDKSEIFSGLENELLQNEVTKDNVETAFLHYLEGLDSIAQLEIAGMYYQESTRTLHVVGRTPGADPRLYYYRQFVNGRRWTAWSKIDCDIKADYVVPLVANERLHLVWPEFRSEAIPPDNLPVPTTSQQNSGTSTQGQPPKQRNMFLAVTEFKSDKWTPKKVSQDPVNLGQLSDGDFHPEQYLVMPIDLTWLPQFFFPGGPPNPPLSPNLQWLSEGPFLLLSCGVDTQGSIFNRVLFELAGCKGYPEKFRGALGVTPVLTHFVNDDIEESRNLQIADSTPDTLTPKANTSLILHQDILRNTPTHFKVAYPHYQSFIDRLIFLVMMLFGFGKQGIMERGVPSTLGSFLDWFYADKLRTFFVRPELFSRSTKSAIFYEDLLDLINEIITLLAQKNLDKAYNAIRQFMAAEYRFELLFLNFYHPLTCLFAKKLYQIGVEGLMARETQFADRKLDFKNQYQPTSIVDTNYPQEIVDFDPKASYSSYNWELFFHAPLMVAERLSQNQKFEDAMRWFHFIFDPTGSHDLDPIAQAPVGSPQKYWITKPFFLRQQTGPNGYLAERLDNLMNLLATDPANPSPNPAIAVLEAQVDDWRLDPFDPHLVAQYRTVAYQKLTVMKYLDNLIAWGDQLFEMDTLESVNSATQLYVVAAEILGQKPRSIPPPAKPVPQTFNELDDKLDAFSNALVDFENLIPPMTSTGGGGPVVPQVPSLLYFCIPQNDKLLTYWGTVEDRLYKIRHCLNIEGVFNPPALFAPPIDPMALVKATAAGLDISTALADLDAPLPFYRFTTMLQKANEFVSDVKALGSALLSALEKKDSEAIALLRQGQEIALLQAVRQLKQRQIDDAQLVIDGLEKNKELVTIRRDFYASRDFMNAGETVAMTLSGAALISQVAGTVADVLAGVMFLIPDFHAGASGFGGSPHVTVQEGGENAGQAATRGANGMYQLATMLDKSASIASVLASYQRRMEDWQNQQNLANKELEQIDKQIASAQTKLDISNKELANHDLEIANSQAVNDFMHSKYTNQDLYVWMIGQISQTYFQAYQVALDLAKRAERCYRYEIGLDDSSFIQFAYWDSLKKGLHAGESLQLDLRRLESAYLGQNKREFECMKHVSLAMLNPAQLVQLRDTGTCTFTLPEELFDLDFAGHYFRRVKTVSITIPCVAGPQVSVNATLRLLKSTTRINSQPGSQYVHNQDDSGAFTDDDRFRESRVAVNAISISSAQNDSGLFELNFRDERYLPFEGAGAISTWQLELTQDPALRQFPYDTISDVILHVRYTSREDTGTFKQNAVDHLKNDVLSQTGSALPLQRLFDLMHEFSTEWYAFLHPSAGSQQKLQLAIRRQNFAFLAPDKDIQLEAFRVAVRAGASVPTLAGKLDPSSNGTAVQTFNFAPMDPNGFFLTGRIESQLLMDESQSWILQLGTTQGQFNTLKDTDVLDCYLIAEYSMQ